MRFTRVSLRRRNISKGRQSLFFDYYPAIRDPETMKMMRWEYLGIYIYEKPKTEIEKEYNYEILQKVEAIRSIRTQSIINEEFGFIDKHKRNIDFLAYFHKIAMTRGEKWLMTYKHFSNFLHGKCLFGDITIELSRKFRDYLLQTDQLRLKGRKLSQNSAAGYFATYRALLSIAYKDKMLRENINDFLDSITLTDVKKEYLTLDELRKLASTPCKLDVLKRASLFSCLTGLRYSDIFKLRWNEIEPAADGGYCMRLRTEKTETETTLPISDEALELCGKRSAGKVFGGLERCMINYPLKDWIKSSGITKHITFHCFRHTFATLQVALGTDIFTVSKMLTHKNISTTQIYAELVNSKKRESANRITLRA